MTEPELIEFVEDCEEWHGHPVTTASAIAEQVGMSRQGAYERLEDLVDDGEVEKYKPGTDVVYWRDSG